jgi:hypothetical protein
MGERQVESLEPEPGSRVAACHSGGTEGRGGEEREEMEMEAKLVELEIRLRGINGDKAKGESDNLLSFTAQGPTFLQSRWAD